ncbi:hypothetical protein H8E88_18720 [candidate division KSB1 bacterium]|nr:hypothetical protein [candidate division KSB1 bacterium]MBL7095120.1 hypothetical protein [candidate division KSB1 bacterium]
MIIVDTNIISTFCRVDKLSLLFKLFPKQKFGIPAAIFNEIIKAVQTGYSFLEKINHFIESDELKLLSLTADELLSKQYLPDSFGAGDLECIIISQRQSHILLTNDKRMRNYCLSNNIVVYDLPAVLRTMWKNGIISKNRLKNLVCEIEEKDNILIKNKEEIYK